MSTERIPQTDSIQELARFWDAHDLTEFEDELEEVSESVFERQQVVKIRLGPQEVEKIEQLAKSQGTDSADLIRQWVLARLEAP